MKKLIFETKLEGLKMATGKNAETGEPITRSAVVEDLYKELGGLVTNLYQAASADDVRRLWKLCDQIEDGKTGMEDADYTFLLGVWNQVLPSAMGRSSVQWIRALDSILNNPETPINT